MLRETRRIWGLSVALVAVAFLATACSSSPTSTPTKKAVTIGFALKPLNNPYFATMNQGATYEAKKLGDHLTVVTASSLSDITGQANRLSALISHGYDCYIANPDNATNLVQPLTQAMAQHRPIVNVDLPISQSAAKAAGVKIDTYIGTNNIQAGKVAATELAKLIPPESQVAMIGGLASDPTSQARLKGFTEGAAGKLDIVQTVAGNWVRATALSDAAAILQARPALRGFFVANGDMALGVQRAIDAAGKQGKVDVIAIIGDTAVLKEVESGTMAAVVEQFPYTIGAMGVQACTAAAEGKKLPANVATPVQVVTKGNAAQALASFPKPFEAYSDPFTSLLAK